MATTEARRKANARWDAENTERISVKLHKGVDPSKDQIKAAAEREGLSVNQFLIYCIRDKI